MAEIKQIVAAVKLSRLMEQHEVLTKYYNDLLENQKKEKTTIGELRVLFDGLKTAKFSNDELHPEVLNFEPMLQELEAHSYNAELAEVWLKRLGQERVFGQRRSDVAYLFGCLLEESSRDMMEPAVSSEAEVKHLLGVKEAVVETRSFDSTWFDNFLSGEIHSSVWDRFHVTYERLSHTFTAPFETEVVKNHIGRLRADIYVLPEQRAELGEIMSDTQVIKEFADVLTIMLQSVEDWTWTRPVPLHTWFTRHKFRTFLAPDIISRLFVEAIGGRIASFVRSSMIEAHPYVRKMNEMEKDYSSVMAKRLNAFREIFASALVQRASSFDPYAMESSTPSVDPSLRLVQAVKREVDLRKAVGESVFVLRGDVKLYFPSLSHAVIMKILKKIGLSDSLLSFCEHFLNVPMMFGEEVVRSTKGIPMDFTLSKVFSELVLFCADLHVYNIAGVAQFRQVDDILVIADSADEISKAWGALNEFLSHVNLELHQEKCGCVGVGAEVPAGLPQNLPSVCLLELTKSGDWQIDRAQADKIEFHLRERLRECKSIFRMVEIYNSFAKYLVRMMCPSLRWAPNNLEMVSERCAHWHNHLFGQNHGIVEEVKELMIRRFLRKNENSEDPVSENEMESLPTCWLFFPITSGGLGLYSLVAKMCSFQYDVERRRKATMVVVPKGERKEKWLTQSNEWGNVYHSFGSEMPTVKPKQTPDLKVAISDFVQRGSKVSGRTQSTLGEYWQWILYVFGPAVKEYLGSFRFLDTEVVPMSLIKMQRVESPF